MKIKLTKLKPSPYNPRVIKEKKFDKLVKSIEELPQMLDLKPLIVNENMEIIAGNMRYRACKKLGIKEVYVSIYSRDIHEQEKTDKTYEEVCEEIMIKDNVSSGDWDWAMLANSWSTVKLTDWGLDVWQNQDDINYIPNYNPERGDNEVTDKDVERARAKLEQAFGSGQVKQDVMCPKCLHEFQIT